MLEFDLLTTLLKVHIETIGAQKEMTLIKSHSQNSKRKLEHYMFGLK